MCSRSSFHNTYFTQACSSEKAVESPCQMLIRTTHPFFFHNILCDDLLSPQRAPRKTRQNKARTMDLFIIVPAQLLLFFKLPLPQGHLDVPVGILAADHESDLARWVRRDRGVGIFDRGEYFFATFLQVGDETEVQPLIFGFGAPGGGGVS